MSIYNVYYSDTRKLAARVNAESSFRARQHQAATEAADILEFYAVRSDLDKCKA